MGSVGIKTDSGIDEATAESVTTKQQGPGCPSLPVDRTGPSIPLKPDNTI